MKNFRVQVIIRVLLLTLTLTASIYLWFKTSFYLSVGLALLLVIFQTIWLINYVEQTNRKLSRFFDTIRYSDFSRSFSGPELGSSFNQLNERFREVVEAFKEQRLEKEAQFRYMQTLVQHIGVGVLSFNQQGEVELLNNAAKRLFDVSGLVNIQGLESVSPQLPDIVKNISSGDRETVKLLVNNNSYRLAIRCTFFRMHGERYKLVSFQDISPELEEKEMESWQKLTKVLAHEIMNSITPIASLSETVHMLLENNAHENDDQYTINKEAVEDVSSALTTIEKRSEGLIRFVNSYRDITKVPEPEVEVFSILNMLERVNKLNSSQAKEQHVSIDISVQPEMLKLTADPDLIEQVLINLTKNAFRALKDKTDGTISLSAEKASRGRVLIKVADDGPGIPEENLEKIFIPFYSTQRPYKQGGSGIGLSLSRQIMRAHGGSLTVQSTTGKGTAFTLVF